MTQGNGQSGNALFLILIAVILFAALSYAITQSNRSGGDPGHEVSLVASTTVTQYPAAIATAITKMQARGTSFASQFDFSPPSDSTFNTAPYTYKVFHPLGGGAVYQNVDPNTVELDGSGAPLGNWEYKNDTAVAGLAVGGTAVAILTHVRKTVCESINQKVTGNSTIPSVTLTTVQALANDTFTGPGVDGHPFLCVATADAPETYLYYHVLVETY